MKSQISNHKIQTNPDQKIDQSAIIISDRFICLLLNILNLSVICLLISGFFPARIFADCNCTEEQNKPATSISPNEKYLLRYFPDKRAILEETATNTALKQFRCNFIYSTVKFSPDSKYVASGSWGKFVKLWSIEQNSYIRSYSRHEDWISCVDFSSDGKLLASGSQDFTAKIYNIDNSEEICSCIGHSSYITFLCFSPQNRYLITRAWDKTAKIWDAETCEELETFDSADSISFNKNFYEIIRKNGREK